MKETKVLDNIRRKFMKERNKLGRKRKDLENFLN